MGERARPVAGDVPFQLRRLAVGGLRYAASKRAASSSCAWAGESAWSMTSSAVNILNVEVLSESVEREFLPKLAGAVLIGKQPFLPVGGCL